MVNMTQCLTKVCKTCKDEKLYEDFNCNKNGVPNRNECSKCRSSKRVGPKQKDRRFRYSYGITLEQYNQMSESQLGVCLICKRKSLNRWGIELCVDHCHETGKVRGLLCDKCNKGLGQFEDNISVLECAIEYLKQNK
jgi:hypothetical protein